MGTVLSIGIDERTGERERLARAEREERERLARREREERERLAKNQREERERQKEVESWITEPDANITFDSVAGLQDVKTSIESAIIWPLLSPTLYQHRGGPLPSPPKGILLFGPPGTGKTMVVHAIINKAKRSSAASAAATTTTTKTTTTTTAPTTTATPTTTTAATINRDAGASASRVDTDMGSANANTIPGVNFFHVSASQLGSKYFSEGEKLVRTLFLIAKEKQPAVIFIDEIDSILKQRGGASEEDASRRMKTEFFSSFGGLNDRSDNLVWVIGATNRPEDLDEAARRRFPCRLFVALPDQEERRELLDKLLRKGEQTIVNKMVEIEKKKTKATLEARGTPEAIADFKAEDTAENLRTEWDKKLDDLAREAAATTDGYSGHDISELYKEASTVRMRTYLQSHENPERKLSETSVADIPILKLEDFTNAKARIKPSVDNATVEKLAEWNAQFGSARSCKGEGGSTSMSSETGGNTSVSISKNETTSNSDTAKARTKSSVDKEPIEGPALQSEPVGSARSRNGGAGDTSMRSREDGSTPGSDRIRGPRSWMT